MIKGRWDEDNVPEQITRLLDTDTAKRYYPRLLLAEILNTYDLMSEFHRVYCENCHQEIISNPQLRHETGVYKWIHLNSGRIPCFKGESPHAATPPGETGLQTPRK